MSFDRYPKAVATTTTDTPVIIEPGYTREWPEEVHLTIPTTYDGAKGWSTSFNANGSGNTRAYVSTAIHLNTNKLVIQPFTAGDEYTSVNPTPSLLAYRTVRGLMPGRRYRLDALIGPAPGHAIAERARLRMGGQASAWVNGDLTFPLLARAVTFTATGDEEDIILEVADNPASAFTAVSAGLHVADITVTALAYTETVPPVIDDQIALPIYSGDLTADAGWAPYVQGSVTVPMASEELGASLDPNGGSRFTITASSIREDIPQWTDWTVQRRNLHPDPGHTLPITGLPGTQGALFGGYTPLPDNNYGTTEFRNSFATGSTGIQTVSARNLPAGAHFGLYFDIDAPASPATTTRLRLDVELWMLVGDAPRPSTLVAGIQVLQGSTVLLERMLPIDPVALDAFVSIDEVLNTPPHGLRFRMMVENRGTAAWQTVLSWQSFGVRIIPNVSPGVPQTLAAIMDGDQAVLPLVSTSTPVPPAQAGLLRYRRDGASTVEETREAAEPIIGIVDEREFDLALASRELDYERGEMTLTLATDEYLLQRFAKPADDDTPRTREHSLRSVIEYVTGEALGTVPPLAGTEDADVTARWAVTNLIPNPVGGVSTLGWVAGSSGGTIAVLAGGRSSNAYRIRVSNSASGYKGGPFFSTADTAGIRVSGGQSITMSCWVRANRAVSVRLAAQYVTDGSGGAANPLGPSVALVANVWTKLELTTIIPRTVTRLGPYVYPATGSSYPASSWIDIDEVMVYNTFDGPVEAFNGGTDDTSEYTYEFAGDAFDSESTRTPRPGMAREREALTWSAGETAWDFISPLVSGAGYRLFCDETRTWRLIDPATYAAPGALTVTPEITVEGKDIIDGERGEYADGVVIHWSWTDGGGITRSKTETAGTEGKVTTVEMNAAYPGEGTAAAHLAQLQKRASSRPVTVATDYRATPDQPVSVTLPDSPTATGEIASVKWDLTTGLMQVEPTALES